MVDLEQVRDQVNNLMGEDRREEAQDLFCRKAKEALEIGLGMDELTAWQRHTREVKGALVAKDWPMPGRLPL